MTAPQFNTLPANEPDPVKRANWLGRYLDVEKNYDEQLKVVLLDSLSGIDDAFEKVGDSDAISKRVRKQQLALSNKAIRSTIRGIFGENTDLIKSSQSDAAVAALDAGLYDQRSILARLFKDPIQREQYAKSLRLTAARNIDAVMTRTLETKRPLSQRVYRTEALAKGQVDRIINRALAKGDSAADIAKAVKGLIDPNVPGGVSYAARRLGRTEINNAFHAQSIHDAQDSPWVNGMRWNLSKRHEDDPGDECETYSEIGVFDKEHVPDKPHPNCRCFVTPEVEAYDDFETNLLHGKYDKHIDDVFGLNSSAEDVPQTGYELSPEAQARVNAAIAKAEAKTKLEAEKNAALKAEQDKGFQIERAKQEKVKADTQAKRDAAEQALKERQAEKEALRKIVDKDKTIPESIEKASSPRQVANFLHDNYLGLRVEGFDTGDIDTRFAKEVATAFERQFDLHPRTSIRKLKIEDLPEGEAAVTRYNHDGKRQSDIVFNRSFASDYEEYQRISEDNQKTGYHGVRDTSVPFEGLLTHEWGHVLDFTSGSVLRRELEPIVLNRKTIANIGPGLFDDYMTSLGIDPSYNPLDFNNPDVKNAYETWVLDGMPSGYSFDSRSKKQRKLNAVESVAESYADSIMNPKPSSVSKAVRRKLIHLLSEVGDMVVGVRKKAKR